MKTQKFFPLESQQAHCDTRIHVDNTYLSVGQIPKRGKITAVQLTKDQVVEIIQQCRGKLIGGLSGLPLAFIANIDQTMAMLREAEPLLQVFHADGVKAIEHWLEDARTIDEEQKENPDRNSEYQECLQLFHTMALICRLLLAEHSPA